jgi:NAD(P)-dependent dehydrogenase (short-subunit alcohol dehydrogenase family)
MRPLLAWLFIITLSASSLACAQDRPELSTGTVLVTGSNRGLGLEFARQYAAAGWRVIATARDPGTAGELSVLAAADADVVVEPLDVRDVAAIRALAEKYSGQPIDVLIANAGVLGDLPGQTLGALDYAVFEEVMAVNVFGALALAEAFRDNVASSAQRKIVAITSRSGIISQPGYRGPYFYRSSKIALNMSMRVLADDLREQGVIVALVSPPPTDTDMLRQLVGADNAARQAEPPEVIARVIALIARLTPDDSGQVLYYDGSTLPW